LKIVERREAPGLAKLYLAELDAQRRIEFVDTLEPGVPKADKWVMMISTQAGCAVGCRMCDAGVTGYRGNLSATEMLDQIRFIAAQNPGLDLARHPKVKIHFARMGEPSLNPAVLEALRGLAREAARPGLIASLSTVAPKSPAITPWFEELRRIKDNCFPGGRFQLQFSLHATDEDRRREIVPIKKWTLAEVADYGRRFIRPGDRKVTLNFAPGPGEGLDADVIARIFDPEHFLVKITPINPTLSARRSHLTNVWNEAPEAIRAAAAELRRRGFPVILSPSFPAEIEFETSCGQLWSRNLKAEASAGLRAERRERHSYVTADSIDSRCEDWLREAQRERRRELPFDPKRAALLVVDMQEFFLDRHSPAYSPPARAVLLNVRRLVEAFRRAGRLVLFTVHAHGGSSPDGSLMRLWWDQVCLAGSPQARVVAVLEPREADVYRKTGYSAFCNPALAGRLRAEGAAQIVLAGVKTDLCVESTARAAFDLGWPTFVAADATAARSEERHVAALRAMARGFSVVTRVEDVAGNLALEAGKS
jgi:23S rRNA (adenine2503-C2)-methyltransferase